MTTYRDTPPPFDPLAAQVQANRDLDAERHPEPAPRIERVDVAQERREREREIATGRTIVKQRGHLQ